MDCSESWIILYGCHVISYPKISILSSFRYQGGWDESRSLDLHSIVYHFWYIIFYYFNFNTLHFIINKFWHIIFYYWQILSIYTIPSHNYLTLVKWRHDTNISSSTWIFFLNVAFLLNVECLCVIWFKQLNFIYKKPLLFSNYLFLRIE